MLLISFEIIEQNTVKKHNFEEYLSVIIVNSVRFTLTENLRIPLLTLQYLKSLVNLIFEENRRQKNLVQTWKEMNYIFQRMSKIKCR